MRVDEVVSTICPLCFQRCYMLEEISADGSIITSYSYDVRLLEDEYNATTLEQGSAEPNTYSEM